MGAWDPTAFGNDDAADWAFELRETDNPAGFISAAFDRARANEYLESADGAVIVAAAALVATACDRTARLLPSELADWLRGRETQIKPLASAASDALAKINGEASELHEAWVDSDAFPEWAGLLESIADSLRV